MKKYMVVTESGTGQQHASFFEDREAAENYRFTACGAMGLEAEVYIRRDETESECAAYEFLYA